MLGEDFKKIIAEQAKRQQEAEKALKNLPYERKKFSPEAVNRIIMINKDLKRIIQGLDAPTALSAVRGYLDSLPWSFTFTSGEVGKATDDDSIYFMTPEGASLRLKRYNMKTGDITKVIQPFMERIVFEDDQSKVFFEPNIGLTVEEYLSPEFLALQKGDEVPDVFESKVRIYNDSGDFIVKNVLNGLTHTGNKVNTLL